ncbi:MAG: putative baseplate assembly protein [Gammaproteobacteria bacterium]|nr:putative baseplate assembly protein [Gammaproteobacteria bacterium]
MKAECCDCCSPEAADSNACGCCDGVEPLTPLSTANRPGLPQLKYRIGSHSSFLETMIARLSSSDYPQLAGLTTRNSDDPSIALLDGWATVADVLTFYQERIVNEGYLRTATERRSVLELAQLVGYSLRPGVSSSVFLAYTVDESSTEEITIPAGSRVQSIPGPDELPQSFETREDLRARAKWNNLKPRMTQPQSWEVLTQGEHVYLNGINTNLKPNDPLLIGLGGGKPVFYRVKEVATDLLLDRTQVTLQTETTVVDGQSAVASKVGLDVVKKESFQTRLIKQLTTPPSLQPANSLRLRRQLGDQFKVKGEAGYRVVKRFSPALRDTLATAAANSKASLDNNIKVYALRVEASLFGHNAPKRTKIKEGGEIEIIGDWPVIEELATNDRNTPHEEENRVYLDARYDGVLRDSWVVVETPATSRLTDKKTMIAKVNEVDAALSRSKYGVTAPTTQIELTGERWITINDHLDVPSSPQGDDFNVIRGTTVYLQPEELELAEEPIESPVCGGSDELLELDEFYDGLEAGRWVIVSGEREIEGTSGVRFSELAMLSSVTQDVRRESIGLSQYQKQRPPRLGESNHTFIKLADKLAYCFKRDTVVIHCNVVKATHGETRKEVLGSGDGSKALQSFELKQSPLTHLSAPNPSGVESTLNLFVNDIEWHESDSLAALSPNERRFMTKTDNDSKTSIIFGNGKEGARLPTGIENIRAEYRNGMGKGGNVKAEQISLLASKPLGVTGVINPLRASGGADRESRDQARKSAPLAVMALDRLVSVRDYKDFSRLYAGIGKSDAVEITNGRQQLVHVTIAGADDIPIDENSDLFINLRRALHDFGDPYQPLQLAVRELMFIVISANVKVQADYQWESVVVNVRATLLDTFSFEQRELGQDVVLSEVMSVIQAVPGVAYVDMDSFGGIPEKQVDEFEQGERRLLTPDEIANHIQMLIGMTEELGRPRSRIRVNLADIEKGAIRPAQLAFLTADVPETLILNQIK